MSRRVIALEVHTPCNLHGCSIMPHVLMSMSERADESLVCIIPNLPRAPQHPGAIC